MAGTGVTATVATNLEGQPTGEESALAGIIDDACLLSVPFAGAGATADVEQAVFNTHRQVQILGLTLVCDTVITADNTNYLTLSVENKTDSKNLGVAVPFTIAGRGTLAAFAPMAFALTATTADQTVPAGKTVTVKQVHGGSGFALPRGILVINYRLV